MKDFTSAELRPETAEDLVKFICGKIHLPQNTEDGEDVVDVIETCHGRGDLYRRSSGLFHVKIQLRRQPDAGSIVVDFGPAETAGGASVYAELAEVIEIIPQRCAAVLAETGFADLVYLIGDPFADAEADDAVGAIFCQISSEGIVAVDDERHFRRLKDCFFECFHCQVDLAVAVELVAEEAGEDHVVGTQVLQHPCGGGLVDLQAGEVSVKVPQRSFGVDKVPQRSLCEKIPQRSLCGGGECGGDAFEHVGAKSVRDDAIALRLEHGAEQVVGGRFAVGAAGHDDPAADVRRERSYDVGIDFQGGSARKRRARAAAEMTCCENCFGSSDCQECA